MPDKTRRTEGNVPQAETGRAVLDAMTDEEIEAAALADPDNPPWTDEQLARAKRVAIVKHLRLKLHLGRSSFASRFHIDEALITAWERLGSVTKASLTPWRWPICT